MNIFINRQKNGSATGVKASILFFTEEDIKKIKIPYFENILKPLFKEKIFKGTNG